MAKRLLDSLFNVRSNFVLARFTSEGFSLSSGIELFTVKRGLTGGQLPDSGESGENSINHASSRQLDGTRIRRWRPRGCRDGRQSLNGGWPLQNGFASFFDRASYWSFSNKVLLFDKLKYIFWKCNNFRKAAGVLRFQLLIYLSE